MHVARVQRARARDHIFEINTGHPKLAHGPPLFTATIAFPPPPPTSSSSASSTAAAAATTTVLLSSVASRSSSALINNGLSALSLFAPLLKRFYYRRGLAHTRIHNTRMCVLSPCAFSLRRVIGKWRVFWSTRAVLIFRWLVCSDRAEFGWSRVPVRFRGTLVFSDTRNFFGLCRSE